MITVKYNEFSSVSDEVIKYLLSRLNRPKINEECTGDALCHCDNCEVYWSLKITLMSRHEMTQVG